MKKALFFSIIALLGPRALAEEPAPPFHIACQLDGAHGNDPDRLNPAKESELVKLALEDAYPRLSKELQDTAKRVTFMVNHKAEDTKIYLGWSAEGDPDYEYPDTDFHPETYQIHYRPEPKDNRHPIDGITINRKGTIKVSLTEKFIQAIDLGVKLGKTDPAAARGIRSFWRGVIAHELIHAWQYHTRPARSLARLKDPKLEEILDPELLAETKRKVQYERQAFGAQRKFGLGSEKDLLALADAVEAHAKAHPELFAPKGPYRLLALDAANPLVGSCLREEAKNMDKGEEFADSAKIIYESEYAPVELLLGLKRLNAVRDAYRKAALELGIDPDKYLEQDRDFAQIREKWNSYMNAGALSDSIKDSFPYLKKVEEAYNAELDRRRR